MSCILSATTFYCYMLLNGQTAPLRPRQNLTSICTRRTECRSQQITAHCCIQIAHASVKRTLITSWQSTAFVHSQMIIDNYHIKCTADHQQTCVELPCYYATPKHINGAQLSLPEHNRLQPTHVLNYAIS